MSKDEQRKENLAKFRHWLSFLLSIADDGKFLRMIWAANALQTDRADKGRLYFRSVPDEAVSENMLTPQAIHPWELETLANELLSTPKNRLYRAFDHFSWNAAIEVANTLRALENAEDGHYREPEDIFVEMGRIGARQFDWQRGFFTVPELYRSAFIYGQGKSAEYFERTHGLTVSDLMFVGFSLISILYPSPIIRPSDDLRLLQAMGVSADGLNKALSMIARPMAVMREEATQLRAGGNVTAYRPSILRRYPCIWTGHRGKSLIAPLPELIMNRVSAGIFYDVVGGGRPVWSDYGRRFESYCFDLLSTMLPEAGFEREWRYRTKLGGMDTPDILMCAPDGSIRLPIECKAARMSVAARFGRNSSDDRGYEEIAKGVFQIWRFACHCREGRTGRTIHPDAKGVVLTLDEWFAARHVHIEKVMETAHRLADESDIEILPGDRRPIAFCTISEFEEVMERATVSSFLAAIDLAATDRRGWIFTVVHQDVADPTAEFRPYPFLDRAHDLLPWFKQIDNIVDEDEGQLA